MTTSIATVTAALVADLDNLLPLTQVIDGPREAVTTMTERVLTVGARIYDASREDDSMDGSTSAEQYTVEMVNSVSLAGADTLDDAVALVLADYAQAEQYIREYPGGQELGLLAGGVLQVAPSRDFELVKRADENGRHAALRWGVRIYAQVT